MTRPQISTDSLFSHAAKRAQAAGVFGSVTVDSGTLKAHAKASAAPAEFRLFLDANKLWVALVTEDRWLSQSIEADLMHTGDKLSELIAEELVDLGWEGFTPTFEHFRDDKKLYTFRTCLTPPLDIGKLGDAATAEKATIALLAYEQCFRALGDMEADDED